MIRPVEKPHISQLWGANPTYYLRAFGIPYHNGVDYAAPLGTPLLAIADGEIAYTGYDEHGYGYYIRLYHPALELFSFYAHLESYKARDSDHLNEGDTLAWMGNTGNSTGPHLHFELRLAIDQHKYAPSPYAAIARGRINPETIYRIQERFNGEKSCPANQSSQPQPSSLSSKPPSSPPSGSPLGAVGYDSTPISNSLS